MHPIHDHDTLLLLAIAIAAKRRPAAPAAVIAAIDLMQSSPPGAERLAETVLRLARLGLVVVADGCVALSSAAEALVEALPAKAGHEERQFELRSGLAAYVPSECDAEAPDAATWHAAVLEHRAAGKTSAKNLLMPKPAPVAAQARPGQRQRKPLPKAKSRKR